MVRTPGLIVPSAYSSKEELEKDLQRRGRASDFTSFKVFDFVEEFIERHGDEVMKSDAFNITTMK